MNEEQAITKVINVLTDHNLRQGIDYRFNHISKGCFNISICPRRNAVLDIEYFYNNIPDIRVFKIQQKGDYMSVLIKVRLRGDCK